MGMGMKKREAYELTLDEIIEDAMTFFDFGPEVMTPAEPGGFCCDMEPDDFELARASIVYLGYQLLLMYNMKRSNAHKSPGGSVAMSYYSSEIRKDLARVLGIRGSEYDRIDEVNRLYKVASKAWDDDEEYRDKIDYIMQGFEEKYGLDSESLGIVFI